jgi:hypothetical protein
MRTITTVGFVEDVAIREVMHDSSTLSHSGEWSLIGSIVSFYECLWQGVFDLITETTC